MCVHLNLTLPLLVLFCVWYESVVFKCDCALTTNLFQTDFLKWFSRVYELGKLRGGKWKWKVDATFRSWSFWYHPLRCTCSYCRTLVLMNITVHQINPIINIETRNNSVFCEPCLHFPKFIHLCPLVLNISLQHTCCCVVGLLLWLVFFELLGKNGSSQT